MFFGLRFSDLSPLILANSADPDEIPGFIAFHLCLHCLLKYMLGVSSKQWVNFDYWKFGGGGGGYYLHVVLHTIKTLAVHLFPTILKILETNLIRH